MWPSVVSLCLGDMTGSAARQPLADAVVLHELWTIAAPPATTRAASLVGAGSELSPIGRVLCRDRVHGPHHHAVAAVTGTELGCGSLSTVRRRWMGGWPPACSNNVGQAITPNDRVAGYSHSQPL